MKDKIRNYLIVGIFIILIVIAYVLVSIQGIEGLKQKEKMSPFKLFYTLFENLGYKTHKWYSSTLPDKKGVFLIFDYVNRHEEQIQNILDKVEEDGSVLFIVGIDEDIDPYSNYDLIYESTENLTIDSSISQDVKKIDGGWGRVIESKLDESDTKLISTKDKTILYSSYHGKGKVYILSDNSLLGNWKFRNENIAILFNNILKPYYNDNLYLIYAGEESKKFVNRSPIDILFEDNFLFITIQLILLGVLLLIWKGKRFGKGLRLNPYERRTLLEHLYAVGIFYRKSKRYGNIDKINSEFFQFRLRKVLNLSYKYSIEKIVDLIKSLSNKDLDKDQIQDLLKSREMISESELLHREKRRQEILEQLNIGKY